MFSVHFTFILYSAEPSPVSNNVDHIDVEANNAPIPTPTAATNTRSDQEEDQSFTFIAKAVMLSVPYAANIGGTGTLIGSPPNLILSGQAER